MKTFSPIAHLLVFELAVKWWQPDVVSRHLQLFEQLRKQMILLKYVQQQVSHRCQHDTLESCCNCTS